MMLAFDYVRLGVDVGHPGLRKQVQIVLFGKLTGGLQGEVSGGLPPAHHVAQVWFVVFVNAVGGDERQFDARILFTDVFHQLAGREARSNDHDAMIHFASVASTSKTSLPNEHSGHRKLSGTSLHGVPGWTSWFGSPFAGS